VCGSSEMVVANCYKKIVNRMLGDDRVWLLCDLVTQKLAQSVSTLPGTHQCVFLSES